MRPLGLVTLRDELRPEAREALATFIAAGVTPKIISGDDPETVMALARQAGLGPELKLLSGPTIDTLDDADLRQAVEETTIFGRITPQQKERLVDALAANGHYVAMIGDGVNDVLPLKKANLGIAMQSGSQATRGVADLILTNDSFAALAPAVLEGQRIRNGMQDILKLFLSRIATVALLIVSSMVVGLFPVHIRNASIVTLMTVGIPTVLLVVWARPGPGPKEGLVRALLHFVVPVAILSSLFGLVGFYGVMELEVGRLGTDVSEASAILQALPIAQTAVTLFLIVVGLFLVIFVEPPTRWWAAGTELSGDWKPTILAVVLIASLPFLINVPILNEFFALSPLRWEYVAIVVLLSAGWVLTIRAFWRYRILERFVGIGPAG
jgi:cation-transporting ATPase E